MEKSKQRKRDNREDKLFSKAITRTAHNRVMRLLHSTGPLHIRKKSRPAPPALEGAAEQNKSRGRLLVRIDVVDGASCTRGPLQISKRKQGRDPRLLHPRGPPNKTYLGSVATLGANRFAEFLQQVFTCSTHSPNPAPGIRTATLPIRTVH